MIRTLQSWNVDGDRFSKSSASEVPFCRLGWRWINWSVYQCLHEIRALGMSPLGSSLKYSGKLVPAALESIFLDESVSVWRCEWHLRICQLISCIPQQTILVACRTQVKASAYLRSMIFLVAWSSFWLRLSSLFLNEFCLSWCHCAWLYISSSWDLTKWVCCPTRCEIWA